LRAVPVTTADDVELDEEASWIYKHTFTSPTLSMQEVDVVERPAGVGGTGYGRKGPGTIGKIRDALNFIRNQHLEVPFIAFYRKEYVEPELSISDLWRVWHMDEKWTQLGTRKKNLLRLFQHMQRFQFESVYADADKPLGDGVRPLEAADIDRLGEVQTMEELQDVYSHFLLYYGRDIPRMHNAARRRHGEEGDEEAVEAGAAAAGAGGAGGGGAATASSAPELKQATRRDRYTLCLQTGLDGLAKKFGLTPQQFGENLRDSYQRHETEQFPADPHELARDYICTQFPTVEAVLEGARYMVALTVAREPLVRQVVRQTFLERAKLNVVPTKKGRK
ncbi:transcription elongation factor SPT6-like, partial [Lampetra fluviatilis]